MSARVDEVVMRGDPFSLTDAELELKTQPLTRTPVAIPAKAWIRYGDVALKVSISIVAWTPKAVAAKWMTPGGAEHRAWIWASAVERD